MKTGKPDAMESGTPPGQRYVRRWVIYSALGTPALDLRQWSLRITGLVEREMNYSYNQLVGSPLMVSLRQDFHCVTGWSIPDVLWEGIPIKALTKEALVKPEAKWVLFRCADRYTAPVPVADALADNSIIAFRMDGKPLSLEQGFPARPVIPHLYAWKSAKWLTEVEFIRDYADGFWEIRGYHERGNVWSEERYKA